MTVPRKNFETYLNRRRLSVRRESVFPTALGIPSTTKALTSAPTSSASSTRFASASTESPVSTSAQMLTRFDRHLHASQSRAVSHVCRLHPGAFRINGANLATNWKTSKPVTFSEAFSSEESTAHLDAQIVVIPARNSASSTSRPKTAPLGDDAILDDDGELRSNADRNSFHDDDVDDDGDDVVIPAFHAEEIKELGGRKEVVKINKNSQSYSVNKQKTNQKISRIITSRGPYYGYPKRPVAADYCRCCRADLRAQENGKNLFSSMSSFLFLLFSCLFSSITSACLLLSPSDRRCNLWRRKFTTMKTNLFLLFCLVSVPTFTNSFPLPGR